MASLTLLPDVTPADAPAGVTDRLSEARWALQACTDAIAQGAPGLSGLLREHTRLVELVVQLEGAGKPDTNPLRAMLRERGLA